MKKVILASLSPRRREMLREHRVPFRAVAPGVNEAAALKKISGKGPRYIACALALEKARSAAAREKKGLVIGADTIVVLGKKIIGKPASRADAFRIISSLSGSKHRVITGVAFIDAANGKTLVTCDETLVAFKKLRPAWIKKYVAENHVLDKAGAYAIQENRDPLVRYIKGSYNNVVGFPVEKVIKILKGWEGI